jgi:hypothetical protein
MSKDLKDLFANAKDPYDWAEEIAREIVTVAFQIKDSFLEYTSEDPDEQLALAMSISLAVELRGIKSKIGDAADSKIEGRIKTYRQKLRAQLSAPEYISEYIREFASKLDERGLSPESNTLRDAANIIEEEF